MKYATLYVVIMPFLHFRSHDNTIILPPACWTNTSGASGTVVIKVNTKTITVNFNKLFAVEKPLSFHDKSLWLPPFEQEEEDVN